MPRVSEEIQILREQFPEKVITENTNPQYMMISLFDEAHIQIECGTRLVRLNDREIVALSEYLWHLHLHGPFFDNLSRIPPPRTDHYPIPTTRFTITTLPSVLDHVAHPNQTSIAECEICSPPYRQTQIAPHTTESRIRSRHFSEDRDSDQEEENNGQP